MDSCGGVAEPAHEVENCGVVEEANNNNSAVVDVDDCAVIKHDPLHTAGKIFVGGVAWETSEASFHGYFSKYGEIVDSVIVSDKISGRPRGFGYVTFAVPEVVGNVLEEEHVINGRMVEVKRTVPREDMQVRVVAKTKKIFVGGLPASLKEDDLKEYFSSYGNVVAHQIVMDHNTGRSRGFGFVTFDNEDAAEKILSNGRMHELGGKQVEIKRAEPRKSDHSHPRSSGRFGGGSEDFAGSKTGRARGGHGLSSPIAMSFAAGYYGGYGGYGGYGYGLGGPIYSGGFGAPVGYGPAAGYWHGERNWWCGRWI